MRGADFFGDAVRVRGVGVEARRGRRINVVDCIPTRVNGGEELPPHRGEPLLPTLPPPTSEIESPNTSRWDMSRRGRRP